MEEVQSRLKPGQPLAELKQVKEQYVIFTVFFKKWRESFATLFPTGFVGSGMDEAEAKALSLEIGWYLFLLAKLHAKRGIRLAPPRLRLARQSRVACRPPRDTSRWGLPLPLCVCVCVCVSVRSHFGSSRLLPSDALEA